MDARWNGSTRLARVVTSTTHEAAHHGKPPSLPATDSACSITTPTSGPTLCRPNDPHAARGLAVQTLGKRALAIRIDPLLPLNMKASCRDSAQNELPVASQQEVTRRLISWSYSDRPVAKPATGWEDDFDLRGCHNQRLRAEHRRQERWTDPKRDPVAGKLQDAERHRGVHASHRSRHIDSTRPPLLMNLGKGHLERRNWWYHLSRERVSPSSGIGKTTPSSIDDHKVDHCRDWDQRQEDQGNGAVGVEVEEQEPSNYQGHSDNLGDQQDPVGLKPTEIIPAHRLILTPSRCEALGDALLSRVGHRCTRPVE